MSAMVSTFRILCSLADFTQVAEPNGRMQSITPAASVQTLNKQQGARSNAHAENGILNDSSVAMPKVTVNLQIQLPETADYEYIDNVFESLARHILGRETPTEDIEFLDEESVENVGGFPSVSENEEESRQEDVDEVE